MIRTQAPTRLDVIVQFTFERQAKSDQIEEFKQALIHLPEGVRCLELEGTSDFAFEASLTNLAAFHDLVAQSIDPCRRLISHYEVNFVSRYFVNETGVKNLVWANLRGNRRCIDLDRASSVVAEGDYVRVRADGDSLMVHSTLQAIEDRVSCPPWIRIHRSILVNAMAVRRIMHVGRRWAVGMLDGQEFAIAKGRHGEVARAIDEARTMPPSHSSNGGPLNRPPGPNDRKLADSEMA